MSDLADFLLARIAEDRAAAEFAANSPMSRDPEWVAVEGAQEAGYTVRYEHMGWELTENGNFAVSDAEHIARWDPARVLAECEAKRRIVTMHQPEPCWSIPTECSQCSFHEAHEGFNDVHEPWPCPTLRLLGLPYADHPDFREEWRP